MADFEVPALVRQRALSNGAAGRRWLDELPGVLETLLARWELTLGAPYQGGTAGYVVRVTDLAGCPAVLKVAMPLEMDEADAFERGVRALELADGRGCARLLGVDREWHAVLLERLGPNLAELALSMPDVLAAVTAALRSLWRPLPDAQGLMAAPVKAAWLAQYIVTTWKALDRPCERAVVDRAVMYCEQRASAFDPARGVLVHGDAHGWNTLRSDDGYRLVDPEGLWSEREHDLAVLMREYNEPLLAGDTPRLTRRRAELLASSCDADPERVHEWGFVERVSTGLANLRELGEVGTAYLEVARRCL